MKEKLYTIPLNDAFNANDECPFCYIEREIEQHLLDFSLGSCASYMESDMREKTDKIGFCQNHFKKMFRYGNALGNAWILKTHYEQIIKEMNEQFEAFVPQKTGFKDKLFKTGNNENTISDWIEKKDNSCYICQEMKTTYEHYMHTFFYLYNREEEFREKYKNCKGVCLHHLKDLLKYADKELKENEKHKFYETTFNLMKENMNRIHEDISWMIEKYDYRNNDADWKNSKDAIQRGMQKLKGGYPADDFYKNK